MNLAHATVAVTGATGFLGGYLITRLLEAGARTVAVVRNPEKAAPLAARGVEVRRADLADEGALTRAFAGVSAVVHNAASVSFTQPRDTMRTNAEGTRHVFRALAAAGVGRAVAISSCAAYPTSYRELAEDAVLRRGNPRALLTAYGESKARAEQIAAAICEEHGIALTTVRPCGITGPGDPLLIPAIARIMGGTVALLPAFTVIGVVHAGDVANAVCTALARDTTAGRVYNLQGHTISLWKLTAAWAHATGRMPWLRIPLPVPFSLRYDDRRARKELDFQPRPIDDILREAVRFRSETRV